MPVSDHPHNHHPYCINIEAEYSIYMLRHHQQSHFWSCCRSGLEQLDTRHNRVAIPYTATKKSFFSRSFDSHYLNISLLDIVILNFFLLLRALTFSYGKVLK